MVYEDSGYDPDEQFRDHDDDGLFFDEGYDNEDPLEDLEDLEGLEGLDGFDPDEEIEAMFPNDEYGDEVEDYILDDD